MPVRPSSQGTRSVSKHSEECGNCVKMRGLKCRRLEFAGATSSLHLCPRRITQLLENEHTGRNFSICHDFVTTM
jgi:hypothetical protein